MAEQDSSNTLYEHLTTMLEKRQALLKTRVAEVRRARRLLDANHDPEKMTYTIVMTSMWADEGEQPLTLTKQGSLAEIMNEAAASFMALNKRSDVQAHYRVYAVLLNRGKILISIDVPEEFWREFTWEARLK